MAAKTTSEMQTVQLLLWDVRKGEQQQQVTLQRQQQLTRYSSRWESAKGGTKPADLGKAICYKNQGAE